ncbi:MAG: substrate-binding domain-containing protein [Gemmataceae bacterium]|nr:substrate-binding domain-containing protein [Gemmataceae bacterium]
MRRLLRPDPVLAVAAGSLVVLAVCVALLYRESAPTSGRSADRPLVVYCAAALRPAMQTTAAEYEQQTGMPVLFRFGNSGEVLANAALHRDGDLFLPADDSFVRLAEDRGLGAEAFPLARMRAVVVTRPGNPRGLARFADLLDPGLKFGQANPDAAAIGKVTRDHLRTLGRWDALRENTKVQHATVTDALNAVQLGATDAAVVWDVVAASDPSLAVVRLPELDGATARVELALLKSSPDPEAARRFARFVRDPDRGGRHFRAAGFTDLAPAAP